MAPVIQGFVRKVRELSLFGPLLLLNLRLQLVGSPLIPLRLTLFPHLLAGVFVLLIDFFAGSRVGVTLAIVLWLASWGVFLTLVADFPVDMSLRHLPQVVGLCILAWWAAKASEILRDDKRRAALQSVWASIRLPDLPRPVPSIALLGVLAALSLGFEADLGPFRIVYSPHYLLFLVLALWASRRDPAVMSSRSFWLLLLLAVIEFDQRASSPFAERPGFALYTLSADATEVVLLAAVHLVVGGWTSVATAHAGPWRTASSGPGP